MLARSAQQISPAATPGWHAAFLEMLPKIRRVAEWAFRKVRTEQRDELVCEVIADALVAFARLVALGKQHLAFPTPLARYAVARARAGRRVGSRLRGCDLLSEYARRRHRFQTVRLDRLDRDEDVWRQIVIEDKRATPAAIAIFRLDFAEWLKRLPEPRREIALVLARGETTSAAAQKFQVTPGRVAQLRAWLKRNWEAFQGEGATEDSPQLVFA
jgi:hypothetical protein